MNHFLMHPLLEGFVIVAAVGLLLFAVVAFIWHIAWSKKYDIDEDPVPWTK